MNRPDTASVLHSEGGKTPACVQLLLLLSCWPTRPAGCSCRPLIVSNAVRCAFHAAARAGPAAEPAGAELGCFFSCARLCSSASICLYMASMADCTRQDSSAGKWFQICHHMNGRLQAARAGSGAAVHGEQSVPRLRCAGQAESRHRLVPVIQDTATAAVIRCQAGQPAGADVSRMPPMPNPAHTTHIPQSNIRRAARRGKQNPTW